MRLVVLYIHEQFVMSLHLFLFQYEFPRTEINKNETSATKVETKKIKDKMTYSTKFLFLINLWQVEYYFYAKMILALHSLVVIEQH